MVGVLERDCQNKGNGPVSQLLFDLLEGMSSIACCLCWCVIRGMAIRTYLLEELVT